MFLELLMGLIVICLHRRFLKRPVHAFHLTIRPWMVGFDQPMVDAIFLTDTIKDIVQGVSSALRINELDAMIGQHGGSCRVWQPSRSGGTKRRLFCWLLHAVRPRQIGTHGQWRQTGRASLLPCGPPRYRYGSSRSDRP